MNSFLSPLVTLSPVAIVLEHDDLVRGTICGILAETGLRPIGCADIAPFVAAILQNPEAKIVFLDLGLGRGDVLDALELLARRRYAGAVQLIGGQLATDRDPIGITGRVRGLRFLPPMASPSTHAMRTMQEMTERIRRQGEGVLTQREAMTDDAGWLPDGDTERPGRAASSDWRPIRLAEIHRRYRNVALA